MKKAFTMIELIFVIVIIGILAAVAIPKLASTTNEAKKTHVISFISVLNTTTGAMMYAKALSLGQSDGDITSAGADLCSDIDTYIDVPDGISMNDDCVVNVDAAKLPVPATLDFVPGTNISSASWKLVW